MNIFLDFLEPNARERIVSSSANSTLRAYNREWQAFCIWCHENLEVPLPALDTTVSRYIEICSEQLSMSTLYRKIAAIGCLHELNDYPSPAHTPAIRSLLEKIRTTKSRQRVQKDPLMPADIRKMVEALPINLLGGRDRCLLLLGFATGLQRSELVALDVSHISTNSSALTITVDKNNVVRKVVIPMAKDPATCPVRAYMSWIEQSQIKDGPLFRWVTRHGQVRDLRLSDKSVSLVVKRAALSVGKDPSTLSSQSLITGRRASIELTGAAYAM